MPDTSAISPPPPAPHTKLLRVLVPLALGGLAGAAGFLLVSPLLKRTATLKGAGPLETIVVLPVLLWLVILVHELGHVCGGWLRGWRFLLLLAGPLRLVRGPGGLDWSFNRALATWGGLAASVPPRGADFRRDMTVVVLSGPVASAVLALAAFALTTLPGRASGHAAMVAVSSLMIALVTLVPLRSGGFASDGMQAWQLLRGGDAPLRRARRVRLLTHGLTGGRPRDLDPDEIAQALAEADTATDAVALWQVAQHAALDRGALDDATAAAREVAARHHAYPDGMRQLLTLDLAWFAARYERDADAARRWLSVSRGGFVEAYQRPLADAGLAWLEGRSAEAYTAIAEARSALRRAMDPGMARLIADQLDALTRDLDSGSPER